MTLRIKTWHGEWVKLECDSFDEFLSCKPGITGWWQVEARNDATYADGSRQQLELYYARHASATLDWNIVLRTIGAVFEGTGK